MSPNVNPPFLIALGANLPHGGRTPEETLQAALAALPDEGLTVVQSSRLYATPCFPAGAGPDYVNAAARCRAAPGAGPREVLAALHRVEARFGRARAERWGMRTLDIDLLAHGGQVVPDPATAALWRALPPAAQIAATPDRLILPHPRLQDRAFVLVPLADVAPRWRHPALGLTVAQMLRRLPMADRLAVVPLDEAGAVAPAVAPMHLFAGRRVAVVGNAQSILGTRGGADIDAADCVVRMNSGVPIDPVAQGRRTDVVAFSTPRNKLDALRAFRAPAHVWMSPNGRDAAEAASDLPGLAFYPMDWWRSLAAALDARPSVGAMVVDMLSHCAPGAVTLHGFDWKRSPSFYLAEGHTGPHDFAAEERYLYALCAARGWQIVGTVGGGVAA